MDRKSWSILRLALEDSLANGWTSQNDYQHAVESLGPRPTPLFDGTDNDTDDLGYNNPNRYICTDPSCDGTDCPGENH